MIDSRFDVVAVGNAIVDVLAHADDAFLARHGLPKGTMILIDSGQAERLYEEMGSAVECSGGSAANTVAGLASLGGRGAYIGKVADDGLGKVFTHDIRAIGVHFDTIPLLGGRSTARCLVLVTGDAQRTMNTYLGACVDLHPDDIDADLVRSARVTYLEGYQWDAPNAKQAILKAAQVAALAGRKVALSLSDPFCVDRHRQEFRDLVANHVDIVFANEDEIKSLYQVATFDDALQAVRRHCQIAVLTRSARGSVIAGPETVHVVDAEPVDRVVDTTGAGDLFASGFLHGYARGLPLGLCGRLGGVCAAEAISHFGARPETSLTDVVTARLGGALVSA